LSRIIRKSLEFQVVQRYPTAADMKADLEAWAEGKPLPSEQPRGGAMTGDDLNATRRTTRSLDDSGLSETRRTSPPPPRDAALEATRRTGELPVAAAVPMPAVPAAALPAEPPPAPPPTRRRRFPLRTAAMIFLLVGSFLLASQVWVRGEAAEMSRDLATQASPDLDGLWTRYRKVAAFSLLPGTGLRDVRDELRNALVKSADRTLNSYRGDDPSSTVKGWQKAHDRLQAAVDLNHRDRPTRAKMLYAQGHLDRIASQSLRGKGSRDEARQKVRDAVDEFEEAAKLAPDWPDPYLGLAHVYAYEQFDLKQLETALNELEKRGYPAGRREKAMLADGYRMQAEQIFSQARAAQGTDQETELLEKARDTFTQSIGLYRDAGNFAGVKANMATAAQELKGILARLEELGVW
jgi:tetratricopeptide (TPR) repeat protein